MIKIKEKPILIWDESNLIDEEVNYIFENDNEEKRTKEQIYHDLEYFFINDEWEYFKEELTGLINDINRNKMFMFKVKGLNMGWRNLEGTKEFKAKDGEQLLKEILPNTNEFTLQVYKKGKYQIIIKCFHHDSPTGEYYFIKPMSKREIKEVFKE